MSQVQINANTVIINGETVAVRRSPKYMIGAPTVTQYTSMVGGKTKHSHKIDYTESFGQVVIAVPNTPESIRSIEDWQENIGKNAIRLIDDKTGFTKTFAKMSMTEDVEIDFEAEETELTFKGDRGV